MDYSPYEQFIIQIMSQLQGQGQYQQLRKISKQSDSTEYVYQMGVRILALSHIMQTFSN